MSTAPPVPVPTQAPAPPPPSVSENVAPIAAAAQSMGPQPGVPEAQMGAPPKAQHVGSTGIKDVLGKIVSMAAIGIGPTVQNIAQQHTKNEQLRNQHVIDTVWQSHVSQTAAMNKINQLKTIVTDIDQHMKDAQALPNDDPTKTQRIGYLAHLHVQVVGELKQASQTAQQNQQTIAALLADPKNRKIVSKAVGYDEKAANTPERQQMIAAIQKTEKGASAQQAALESQFSQGTSQATPGLPAPVQQSVLKGAETQAQVSAKEDQTQAFRERTNQPKTTKSALKPGVVFDQGVPFAWNSPDGKQYTSSNPDLPTEGKEAIGDALKAYLKAKGDKSTGRVSGLALYTLSRMMQMGYSDNPAMLGAMGDFAKAAGVNLPPSTIKILSQIPHDQPLSPTTGKPIGTHYPGAPTGSTRSQAQTAQRVLSELPRLKQEVNDAANNLGPIQGRKTMAFLLGTVGSTGDPQKDQQLNELRSDLTFAGSASAKFHINSVRAMEQFDKLAQAGKNTAPAIQGFLNSVESWASTAAKQERGYGEQGVPKPPEGATQVGHDAKGNIVGWMVGNKWVNAEGQQ